MFQRIAEAEGRVHGVSPEEVHFHEVGAVDSILDIVGTMFCLKYLGVGKVFASALPMGRGFVKTLHGTIPLPAPATSALLAGVPVYGVPVERELVTPTGAAILSGLAESFGPVPAMTLVAIGYGVGAHPAHDPPNLLRLFLGKVRSEMLARDLLVVETNIDDMNPEFYNYLIDRLFASGVLDVSLVPVQMKKNRPGVLLRVLLEPGLERVISDILFTETTTLGIRVHGVKRVEIPREEAIVMTGFGRCRVKRVLLPNGSERLIPEYEECRRIAEETGVPIPDVYSKIVQSAESDQGYSSEQCLD
ncbi:MAG: nickel pincer cofactor biosynthesis protein LarC [Syntrophobacteraceae bacterium]